MLPARLVIASRSSATVLLEAACATHRLCNGAGLLTLPASSRLRSLSFVRRAGTRRLRLDAPAAGRQCGWSAAPDVPRR